MTVRLSAAQAAALGLVPGKGRSTRRTLPGVYWSRCLAESCGQVFTSRAAEDRHVSLTHCRFETLEVAT